MAATNVSLKELRRVVIAASVGNIIEWYDFYIFGSLASILAVKFFEKSHPVAAFLSTVAIFSVGFLIRPLGAFCLRLARRQGRPEVHLHRHADRHGRGDGPHRLRADLSVDRSRRGLHPLRPASDPGALPGRGVRRRHHVRRRAHRGRASRVLHRLAPDVAHARHRRVAGDDHRHRTYLGDEAFNDWGWRVPFIISLLLVAIAIWIRLSLGETPIFQDIKARGRPPPIPGARRS